MSLTSLTVVSLSKKTWSVSSNLLRLALVVSPFLSFLWLACLDYPSFYLTSLTGGRYKTGSQALSLLSKIFTRLPLPVGAPATGGGYPGL
jgi:hypothetical protein